MDSRLYNKTIICPICSKNFDVTKVKTSGIKVLSRDSDFFVSYGDINPLFYDVMVCEHCGYAAQTDKFDSISVKESKVILDNITPRWNKRAFFGARNIDNALEAFRLALFNLHIRKANSSDFAKLCLRIAWLYRIKKDEKEKEFLQFALNNYIDAFEKERFPIDKLDEYTCMYMIAEIYRRLENMDEAVKWFSRLIGSPDARKNSKLLEMAREQYQLAKESMQ